MLLFSALPLGQNACAQSSGCNNDTVPSSPPVATYFTMDSCAARYGIVGDNLYTTKVVACAEGAIRGAVMQILTLFSNYFGPIMYVLLILVMIFYGVRVATGERDVLRQTMTLALKLAFVAIFVNQLPLWVNYVYGILAQFLALVSHGSPWVQIDTFMGNLFGFAPGVILTSGLVGVVGASAFSSSVGMLLFFTGIMAILNIISFVLGLVYTYLLAMLVIGFLLVLSPLMIPLALFFYTERYMKKWIDIIVSAILTPVLLFAFVWLFIGIFDTLIDNIFGVMGGRDFQQYLRLSQPIGPSWQQQSDPNTTALMQNVPTTSDLPCVSRVITPPVQKFLSPLSSNAFEAGGIKLPAMDFGANHVNIIQRLSFAFMTLWIFSSIMKSLLEKIPGVASSIASVSSQISYGGQSALLGKLEGAIQKTQSTLGSNVANDKTKFDNVKKLVSQMSSMLGRK